MTNEAQQQKITDLQDYVLQCQRQLAEALADDDTAVISKCRKAVDQAVQARDDAVAVLTVLREREAEAEQQRKADTKAAAWAQVRTLAESRTQLIEQIETGIAALGPLFSTLSETNRDILATVPQNIDSTRAELFNAVDMCLELFWKAGVVAGSPFNAYELDRRPTLPQRIRDANGYLSSFN